MRMAILIVLAMSAWAGTKIQANVPINDPIVSYIKIPLWGGLTSRWYIYTENGFVAPINDDLPAHIDLQISPFFDLIWLLNLTGKSVLTPDQVRGISNCVNRSTPQYKQLHQLPTLPDDIDYIDNCLRSSGFILEEEPAESSSVVGDLEN